MEVDFKLGSDEFKVSKEDIEAASANTPIRGDQSRGYFVEVNGKAYRMLNLLQQLCKDKGLKISKFNFSPDTLGIKFEEFGFRAFKKIPLSQSKNIILLQNIHNLYNSIPTNTKPIYPDRLIITNYEFIQFKIISLDWKMISRSDVWKNPMELLDHPESAILDRTFTYFDTCESLKLQKGLVAVTYGIREEQEVLFISYEEDVKKYMDDLAEFITVMDDLIAKPLSKDKESHKQFKRALNKQIEEWKARGINEMSVMVGNEIIDFKYNPETEKEFFRSVFRGERYSLYYHPAEQINEKEMKTFLEAANFRRYGEKK